MSSWLISASIAAETITYAAFSWAACAATSQNALPLAASLSLTLLHKELAQSQQLQIG